MSSRSTRARLLTAAAAVVRAGGAGALTLDAVATEAGVSKGGLLYHFASKDALYRALLDQLLDGTDEEVEALAARDRGPAAGRFTRAFVRSSFAPGSALAYGPGFAAAVAARPELLDAARARYAEWQRRVETDGLDPAVATAARLAADGMFLADVYGLAPPTGAERAAAERVILALCSGSGAGP